MPVFCFVLFLRTTLESLELGVSLHSFSLPCLSPPQITLPDFHRLSCLYPPLQVSLVCNHSLPHFLDHLPFSPVNFTTRISCSRKPRKHFDSLYAKWKSLLLISNHVGFLNSISSEVVFTLQLVRKFRNEKKRRQGRREGELGREGGRKGERERQTERERKKTFEFNFLLLPASPFSSNHWCNSCQYRLVWIFQSFMQMGSYIYFFDFTSFTHHNYFEFHPCLTYQ